MEEVAERRNLKHQAVVKCTSILVTAVQNCIGSFTSECLSRRLISDEVNDYTLTSGYTDSQKARRLVSSVRDAIKNDPSRFDILIDVMEKFSHLESEVESLQSQLHELTQCWPHNSSSSSETDGVPHSLPSVSAMQTSSSFAPTVSHELPSSPSGEEERAMETEAVHGARSQHQSSSSAENDGISYEPSSHSAILHTISGASVENESETAMDIGAEQGPVVGHEEIISSCTIPKIIDYIKDVKNVRAFGILLEIDSGKLDEIERSSSPDNSRIVQIVREWLKKLPDDMSNEDRWEELGNVLLQPAVDEPGIAIKLKPYLRRGSSVDSAISVFSNRSGSFSSPSSPSPYQMSYIESIGRRPAEDCSKPNVLNCIVPYSEWYEIGLYLNLPVDKLNDIKECSMADRKSLLIELWYRQGLQGFTWPRLQEALTRLLRWKSGSRGSNTSATMSFTQPPIFITPPHLHDQTEESTRLYSEQEISEEYEQLQAAFQSIQENILEVLEQKGVVFRQFKRALSTFSAHVQLNSYKNLKTVSGKVEFDDIFSMWNEEVVWSFLDFTLLEGIVKRYGSQDLKDSMRDYSTRLQEFRRRTLVSRLMKIWTDPNPPEEYETCKTLILRLNIRADNCTLEMLHSLKNHSSNKLLKRIQLSEAALILFHIGPGSVRVTWVVQKFVVERIKEALIQCIANGEYFKESAIISALLDGELFMSMEQSLIFASEEGDIEKVDDLIDKKWNHEKHNINETGMDGETALMLASANGHESIVCALLESGDRIDIDYQKEDTKWSALFFAYENGQDRVVKRLLEYGANTMLLSNDNKLATGMRAEKKGFVKRMRDIVSAGKLAIKKYLSLTINKKLFSFCEIGYLEGVKSLLEEGAMNINIRDSSHNNWTPLMWACDCGHYEVMKLLLKHGADINLFDSDDKTALYHACVKDHIRIAYHLMRSGADPNKLSKRQYTPLMYIIDMEHMEPMARALLKHGASVEITEKKGWTSLILASHYGKKELVKLFLDHGAEVNHTAARGWTALMAAARKNHGEIVKLLLDNGACMELTMKDAKKVTGEPALHIASYMGSTSVVPILVEHGADLNVYNKAGLFALMIATKRQNIEVLDSLCQSPTINVDQQQKGTGLTALFLAAKNGDRKILRKLLEYGASEEITIGGQTVNVCDVADMFKKKAIIKELEAFKLQRQRELEVEKISRRSQPALELKETKLEEVTQPVVRNEGTELDHSLPPVASEGKENATPELSDDHKSSILLPESEPMRFSTTPTTAAHSATVETAHTAVAYSDQAGKKVQRERTSNQDATPGLSDDLDPGEVEHTTELEPEIENPPVAQSPIEMPESGSAKPMGLQITPTTTTYSATDTTATTPTEKTTPIATDVAAADPPEPVHEAEEESQMDATTHQGEEPTQDSIKDSSSKTGSISSLFEAEEVDHEEIHRQQNEREQKQRSTTNKDNRTMSHRQPIGRKGIKDILRRCFDDFEVSWSDYEHLRIVGENTGKGVQSPTEDYQNMNPLALGVH